MSKYLKYMPNKKKFSYNIIDYKDKSNRLFPSLRNYSTKNKSKSMTNIFFSSKGNLTHKNNINLNGGKINVFNFDLDNKIPKSHSKFDYVPLCLLSKNKSALPL